LKVESTHFQIILDITQFFITSLIHYIIDSLYH